MVTNTELYTAVIIGSGWKNNKNVTKELIELSLFNSIMSNLEISSMCQTDIVNTKIRAVNGQ